MWSSYALVRLVPRPELPDGTTLGAVLFCRQQRQLLLRWVVDDADLGRAWPGGDTVRVRQHMDAWERVALGDATAGPLATMALPERFRWLVAPRSTVIQPGPVHEAHGDDPMAILAAILDGLDRG